MAKSEGYNVCRTTEAGCNPIAGATAWYEATEKNPAGHVAHVEDAQPLIVTEMDYYKSEDDLNYPEDAPSVWLGEDRPMKGGPDGYIFGRPGESVALFKHQGFLPGSSLRFNNPGKYNVTKAISDHLSSVSVADGWAVKLYEHADQSGACLLVDQNVRNLPAVGNGVSSVEVFYGVCPALGKCRYHTEADPPKLETMSEAGICGGAALILPTIGRGARSTESIFSTPSVTEATQGFGIFAQTEMINRSTTQQLTQE